MAAYSLSFRTVLRLLLSFLLATVTAATDLPGGCVGRINAVSRAPGFIDAFTVGSDGNVYTAAWQPGNTVFGGWWQIPGFKGQPCIEVAAVSRSLNHLDVFAVGLDSQVYTASWEPDFTSWHGWFAIPGRYAASTLQPVTAISRSADKLDIFMVAIDGFAYTAAWEPDFTSWHGWFRIGDYHSPIIAGTRIGAVSRSADHIDIFAVTDWLIVQTAAYQPGFAGFQGWWNVSSQPSFDDADVAAVSRGPDLLDIFMIGEDKRIYQYAWQPGATGWTPLGAVGGFVGAFNTHVTAISAVPNTITLLLTGQDSAVYAATWSATTGWGAWLPVAGGLSAPASPVAAVQKSPGRLDVFVAGLDQRVWSAALPAGASGWCGWWHVMDTILSCAL